MRAADHGRLLFLRVLAVTLTLLTAVAAPASQAPDFPALGREILTYAAGWRKPLAVLIDGGTRSGKEVVSRALQKSRRAVLVGERTAGAVVAGQILPLSDGSLLFLAAQDILVDGERLEGVGVKPDVEVPAALPFAEGRDPQLEAALNRLYS